MKQFLILILSYLLFDVVYSEPIEKAQTLKTKWGYAEVYNDVYLFWWLYMQHPPTKPLLIWLGFHSTAEANFNQYGPITSDLEPRNNSLVHEYNILYIDSVAGTGFSYTKKPKLFSRNTHETAYDLYTCIKLFFHQFPAFNISPVYIVADSFFGAIAPQVAELWESVGSRENLQYNLKGLIVGVDPYYSLQEQMWRNYVTTKNSNETQKTDEVDVKMMILERKLFRLDQFPKVNSLLDNHQPFTLFEMKSFIQLATAFIRRVLATTDHSQLKNLMNYYVKKELSLQSNWKPYQSMVLIDRLKRQSLLPTFKKSYGRLLEKNHLKIVFFNTPMDLKINTKQDTFAWMKYLDWKDKHTWDVQAEIPFTFNNTIKGFKKSYNNLYQYLITENSNPNSKTNADFLRNIFAEFMK